MSCNHSILLIIFSLGKNLYLAFRLTFLSPIDIKGEWIEANIFTSCISVPQKVL